VKPQRVVYVLKIFPKISETFIASELAELRRRGIELRIFSLLPPSDALRHAWIAEAGLNELVSYEPATFLGLARNFQPQLFHAHFATESTATARTLAAELAIPFTFTAHGYDIHRKPPADFSARATAAARVITVSQANAAFIEKNFSVPASHIRVIACGVDLARFQPGNEPAMESEPPWVVCVARQVVVKNLRLLLHSCARLRDEGISFRCALIGDGPCRAELERLRVELGLQNILEMPGSADQTEVRAWWGRAAVGVLTSDNEGMPLSLMEAAACGVPVVATAVGGIPELVEDGVTGLLAGAGDVAEVAFRLGCLLKDPALRRRMGVAARKRAEQLFSLERQVDQLLGLWSEMVDR
jgi:glycosyltransferase involved in cell wall biosynthesis